MEKITMKPPGQIKYFFFIFLFFWIYLSFYFLLREDILKSIFL
jgi:hypothetical protein